MKLLLTLLLLLNLTSCAVTQAIRDAEPPTVTKNALSKEFDTIPAPAAGKPITVAVYSFADKTGQRKPTANVASISTAVTQGAETFLIKALQDVGKGRWFEVVERVNIDSLTKERQIIRQMREAYEGDKAKPLMPMMFAGIIVEGGIVGYDSSVRSGGMAARVLDIDFLKETGLANAFDSQSKDEYSNKLDRNPLDNAMLPNILDLINAQLAAYMDFLSKSSNKLLPDYKPSSGVIAEVDDLNVTLYKEFDGNVQSVTVNKNSSLTIYQENGAVSIKNRVNSDGNTTIRLKQQ